jgi:hypothetical protein
MHQDVKAVLSTSVKVFEGFLDDPRNTDNAWIESTAMYVLECPLVGLCVPLSASWLVDFSAGSWLVGWLVGWLVRWFVGWLVGWLIG